MSVVWPVLIVLALVSRPALGIILYGFFPGLARVQLLAPDSPAAVAANAKYGDALKAAGFRRLTTLRRSLPLWGRWRAIDVWADPVQEVFALVLPGASALMFVSYFEPGPAAVVTIDRESTARRRPGYWREAVLGLSLPVILASHLELAETFNKSHPSMQRLTDLTLEGFRRAERSFDGGYGRKELVKQGLTFLGRMALVCIASCAFVLGFQLIADRLQP